MAEKWTIKDESGRGKSLPLYYAVYSADGHLVSMHYAREDANQMAASPLMLEALNAAREYINDITTNCRECSEPDSLPNRDLVINMIDDAIAATKGE
jgi:hypothetical protein